jgi:hypothetical protein
MRLNPILALGLMLVVPAIASADETIANPEFASWSKFKKGTSVTLKMTTVAAGTKSETTVTTTLIETGADKLVVETTSVANVAGMVIKSPAFKRDVQKTVMVPKGLKKEELQGGKPPGTTQEGTETIKIAGTDVKTKWYKYQSEAGGVKSDSKMWMSEDVPGMMVKMESSTAGAIVSTMKMQLVEIKKP